MHLCVSGESQGVYTSLWREKESKNRTWEDALGHIFTTETAETAKLDAMFARFGDKNGGYFSGSAVRDEVSYIEVPLFDGAFHGRIPSSETKL